MVASVIESMLMEKLSTVSEPLSIVSVSTSLISLESGVLSKMLSASESSVLVVIGLSTICMFLINVESARGGILLPFFFF